MMHERLEKIIAWLEQDGSLRVDQLANRLGVSVMTIHRDLDKLSEMGFIRKVHGGAIRLHEQPNTPPTVCALCHIPLAYRITMTIQVESGHTVEACCPHCGLLLLGRYPSLQSVLVRDFLFGRVLHADLATYLLESELTICCAPSVITFATQKDAQRFQKGWGGHIVSFDEALRHLREQHRK